MMGLLGFEMLMIRLWNTDQPDPEKAGCWETEVSVGSEVSMCNGKNTIFLEVSSPNLHHQNMDPQDCHAWRWKFLGQTKIAGYTYSIYGMYGLDLELCCIASWCNMGAFPALNSKLQPRIYPDQIGTRWNLWWKDLTQVERRHLMWRTSLSVSACSCWMLGDGWNALYIIVVFEDVMISIFFFTPKIGEDSAI